MRSAWPRPDLNVREGERGLVLDRQLNHVITMACGSQGTRLFVRRVSGRDEEYPVQMKELPCRLCDRQMAPVNRIKTAAQESQAHAGSVPTHECVARSRGAVGCLSRPASVAEACGRLKDHQVVPVDDFFILLQTGDLLDVGGLEALDAG